MFETNQSPLRIAKTVAAASLIALSVCLLAGCSNSDQARDRLKREAEDGYGVLRTVTAYSQTGEEIGSWYGKIDIDYSDSDEDGIDKVDLVFFDGSEPVDRVVISGPAIVVADSEGEADTEAKAKAVGSENPRGQSDDAKGQAKPETTEPDVA